MDDGTSPAARLYLAVPLGYFVAQVLLGAVLIVEFNVRQASGSLQGVSFSYEQLPLTTWALIMLTAPIAAGAAVAAWLAPERVVPAVLLVVLSYALVGPWLMLDRERLPFHEHFATAITSLALTTLGFGLLGGFFATLPRAARRRRREPDATAGRSIS